MGLSSKIVMEGQKNAAVLITGDTLDLEPYTSILRLESLHFAPKSIRLDSIVYAFQDKAGLEFWWDEGVLALPLEGRGKLDLGSVWPLHSPDNWGKELLVRAYGPPGLCTVLLDVEKQ